MKFNEKSLTICERYKLKKILQDKLLRNFTLLNFNPIKKQKFSNKLRKNN